MKKRILIVAMIMWIIVLSTVALAFSARDEQIKTVKENVSYKLPVITKNTARIKINDERKRAQEFREKQSSLMKSLPSNVVAEKKTESSAPTGWGERRRQKMEIKMKQLSAIKQKREQGSFSTRTESI